MLKKTITFIKRQKNQIIQGGYRVLVRKLKLLFPKMLRAPLYMIELPVAFFIFITMRLIKYFFLIRVERFMSHRLGHFTVNIEKYLLEYELGFNVPSQPHLDVWYHSVPICNQQIATMWSRTLHIGPRRIMKMVDTFNSFFPGGVAHKIYDQDHGIVNQTAAKTTAGYRRKPYYSSYFDNTPPHLNFLPKEELRGEAGLRAMGIPEGAPFVVLIVRDSAYLDDQSKNLNLKVDWSYHDFRNGDVQNYILAAKELAERGYYVIRVGAAVNEPMNVDHPMIIDYATNGMRSDFMDIYLGAKCAFCISNSTGYDGIPYIFRKPILYIDHVPLGIINTYNENVLITTKKHWMRNENRFMTFEEMLDVSGVFLETQLFENLGIDLFESTPEEIKTVVIEMVERLAGNWQTTREDEALQDKFWDLFPAETSRRSFSHGGEIRSRMGANFLRKNRELL